MINPNNLCLGCMNEKVTEGKCPICGYNPDEPTNPVFLKPGTLLDGRYVIGKVIDNNGEGVTYLGFDTVTSGTVNVREFFPTGLCEREEGGTEVIMCSGSEFDYNDALMKFIDLSKALFKLNELPALFDVLDVRETGGTAYRITASAPGISLREFLMRNGGVLKWDQARSLFAPLIASISAMHNAGVVHRGISPDTLIVGKDGKLRLSGFCIAEARTAKSSLTSQLFPGFAAVEQYTDVGTVGPWTDVYAFAATIYRTLVGNPPPEAIGRLEDDNMTIPAKIARETPKAVLETLANALQVLPNDRTRYIDDMRRGLSVSSAQTEFTAPVVAPVPQRTASASTSKNNKKRKGSGKMYGLVAGIVTVFVLAIIVFFVLYLTGAFSGSDASSDTSSGNGLDMTLSTPSQSSKTDITFEEDKTALPSFVGLQFSDVLYNREFTDVYTFKISAMKYSDSHSKGQIIDQTPAAQSTVENGTTVEFVVSLGPYYMNMPNVIGKGEDEATLILLKAGFDMDNINFEFRYDDTKSPGVIIESDPEKGANVNENMKITLVINRYQGPSTTPDANNSSNQNSTNAGSENP